jgi:IS30 family transposase
LSEWEFATVREVEALTGEEGEIEALREVKVSKTKIGRLFGMHRFTVDTFMKANGLK